MDIEKILNIVTPVTGVVALWFGVWQYRNAQLWKRLEYVSSVLNKINTDPDLRLAITFLDWRERDIVIPERFLFPTDKKQSFRHTHQLMADAFDLRNREPLSETGDIDLKLDKLTPERILYVDVFDRFFEYLEQLYALVRNHLVEFKDMVPVNYWANRVYQIQVDGHYVFQEYLKHYEYKGVLALVEQWVLLSGVFPARARDV